jgi:hypothetical protein
MSDETTPTTPAAPPDAAPTRPTSILTNPKDQAARPGFRSPANSKSKAQKGKKK